VPRLGGVWGRSNKPDPRSEILYGVLGTILQQGSKATRPNSLRTETVEDLEAVRIAIAISPGLTT
jgi:hypothetical protein